MIRLPLVFAVSLVASAAHADVTGVVGLGASYVDDSTGDTPVVPALDALVAFRVGGGWSLGGRLQVSGPVHASYVFSVGGGGDYDDGDYTLNALDLGVTALYTGHHAWVAPWIGEHSTFGSMVESGQAIGRPFSYSSGWFFDTDFLELGLTVGVDVIARGPERIAIYADYHHGLGRTPSGNDPGSDAILGNWSAATVGVAYHR